MSTGTVKFFNTAKGFGFIVPDVAGDDIFVHASDLDRSCGGRLWDSQKVKFTIGENRGKSCAKSVVLVDGQPPTSEYELAWIR